jgi:hypothetical protein
MKLKYFLLCFFVSIVSCKFTDRKGNAKNENTIISKIHYKINSSETDTIWVSQNDTTAFRQIEEMITRPCSNPELVKRYELLKPRNEAYYFIYNNKAQLISEGKYTNEYIYEGQTYKVGNFYNSKDYFYESNGNLDAIHYMVDGRSNKTESFDSKKRLTEVIYFNEKSSNKTKVEIYDDGELEKTHIYTSFDNYYTVKAKNKKFD